mmetsp:Transcript_15696/g.44836  ORF Transcript_15696/g.44836 Transcript_15696/m.44836 type:complete len:281 (-) Transcript_15696:439-1281(-)
MDHFLTRSLTRERDIHLLGHAAPRRLVKLLGPVGGSNEEHLALCRSRVASLHLNQDFSLEAPARLVLSFTLPRRKQRVDFVDEDDRRGHPAGDCKKGLDHLLAVTDPLGGQRGGRYGKERGRNIGGDGFPQEGLSRPRWAEQQDPLGWRPSTFEDFRVHHGPNNHLLDQSLGRLLPCNILPRHRRTAVDDFVAHLLNHARIDPSKLIGQLLIGIQTQKLVRSHADGTLFVFATTTTTTTSARAFLPTQPSRALVAGPLRALPQGVHACERLPHVRWQMLL